VKLGYSGKKCLSKNEIEEREGERKKEIAEKDMVEERKRERERGRKR
jgi:hypothetical protein